MGIKWAKVKKREVEFINFENHSKGIMKSPVLFDYGFRVKKQAGTKTQSPNREMILRTIRVTACSSQSKLYT